MNGGALGIIDGILRFFGRPGPNIASSGSRRYHRLPSEPASSMDAFNNAKGINHERTAIYNPYRPANQTQRSGLQQRPGVTTSAVQSSGVSKQSQRPQASVQGPPQDDNQRKQAALDQLLETYQSISESSDSDTKKTRLKRTLSNNPPSGSDFRNPNQPSVWDKVRSAFSRKTPEEFVLQDNFHNMLKGFSKETRDNIKQSISKKQSQEQTKDFAARMQQDIQQALGPMVLERAQDYKNEHNISGHHHNEGLKNFLKDNYAKQQEKAEIIRDAIRDNAYEDIVSTSMTQSACNRALKDIQKDLKENQDDNQSTIEKTAAGQMSQRNQAQRRPVNGPSNGSSVCENVNRKAEIKSLTYNSSQPYQVTADKLEQLCQNADRLTLQHSSAESNCFTIQVNKEKHNELSSEITYQHDATNGQHELSITNLNEDSIIKSMQVLKAGGAQKAEINNIPTNSPTIDFSGQRLNYQEMAYVAAKANDLEPTGFGSMRDLRKQALNQIANDCKEELNPEAKQDHQTSAIIRGQ